MKTTQHSSPDIYAVICGSFRKHLPQIITLKKMLEKHKIAVLSPAGDTSINPDEEFILLDTDPVSHPKLLQDSVFAKIRRSSFIVIANIDGYLGKAAILEMGYAIANGIDIYTVETITDPNLHPYCKPLSELFEEISPAEIAFLVDEQRTGCKQIAALADSKKS